MPHNENLHQGQKTNYVNYKVLYIFTLVLILFQHFHIYVRGPEPSATYAFNKVPRKFFTPQALPSTSTICESTTYKTFQQKRLLDNTREH